MATAISMRLPPNSWKSRPPFLPSLQPCLRGAAATAAVFRNATINIPAPPAGNLSSVTMKLMGKCLVLIAAAGLCLAADAPVSLTGVIGDDMCSGDHKKMGGTDATKCTMECVKG